MNTKVLEIATQKQSNPKVQDSISLQYGNGYDICTVRTYTISSTPEAGTGSSGVTPSALLPSMLTIDATN